MYVYYTCRCTFLWLYTSLGFAQEYHQNGLIHIYVHVHVYVGSTTHWPDVDNLVHNSLDFF